MSPIELKDPAAFGNEFLRLTLLQGFQSLTKRDLELLIFVLLERDGTVGRDESNATVAARLRVTPAKIKALRRDGYARWRALVPEDDDRATRGAAYDVIVDLRGNSATFGRWFAVELTCDNRWALAIPSGCAHGLLTLADDTEVFYQMSAPYCPAAARGVRWDDPALGIEWPEAVQVISERDRSWPLLALGPRAEFSTSAAGQEACA